MCAWIISNGSSYRKGTDPVSISYITTPMIKCEREDLRGKDREARAEGEGKGGRGTNKPKLYMSDRWSGLLWTRPVCSGLI